MKLRTGTLGAAFALAAWMTPAPAGAALNARDANGMTPLHLTAWFGKSPAVARALIEAGADAGAKDRFGRTPLYYTKRNESIKGSVAYFKPRERTASRPGGARWKLPTPKKRILTRIYMKKTWIEAETKR